LRRNKRGRIVSKKASAAAKARGGGRVVARFGHSVALARKILHIKGFQAVGGKTAQGQKLLKKAKEIYANGFPEFCRDEMKKRRLSMMPAPPPRARGT